MILIYHRSVKMPADHLKNWILTNCKYIFQINSTWISFMCSRRED